MGDIGDVLERAQSALNAAQEGIRSAFKAEDSLLPNADRVYSGVNSGLEKLSIGNVVKLMRGGAAEDQQPVMSPVLFTVDNPVFRSLAVCAGLLGAKLVLNSSWTVYNRVKRQAFSQPEDNPAFGGTNPNNNDPVVERVRRMHLNDIENYTPFFILSLLYVATEPDLQEANLLFRSFVAVRLAHTGSYLALQHQPGRFLCFLGGWCVNAFLAYRVLRGVF